jgi:hypothetical protein
MTREQFIKKWLGNKDYQYTEQNRDLMRDDLDKVINKALCQPAVISWVEVSERLPKIGEITDVYISIGHRVTNYKWEDYDLKSSFMPHEITHWAPIPKPPCL